MRKLQGVYRVISAVACLGILINPVTPVFTPVGVSAQAKEGPTQPHEEGLPPEPAVLPAPLADPIADGRPSPGERRHRLGSGVVAQRDDGSESFTLGGSPDYRVPGAPGAGKKPRERTAETDEGYSLLSIVTISGSVKANGTSIAATVNAYDGSCSQVSTVQTNATTGAYTLSLDAGSYAVVAVPASPQLQTTWYPTALTCAAAQTVTATSSVSDINFNLAAIDSAYAPPETNASADSWVGEAASTTNHGNDTELRVGKTGGAASHSLLRFDDLNLLSKDTVVSSATLNLYNLGTGSGGAFSARVQGNVSSFTEGSVTWSNAPTYATAIEASASTGAGSGWVSWDVTDRIRKIVRGELSNIGVRITQDPSVTSAEAVFASSNATDSTLWPTLVVTYVPATRYGVDRRWTYGPVASYGGGTTSQTNIANGNLLVQQPISSVPARGFDVALSLTYNSEDRYGRVDDAAARDSNGNLQNGRFYGNGWTLSQNLRLSEFDSGLGVAFKDGDGTVRIYVKDTDSGNTRTYSQPLYYDYTLAKDLASPPTDSNAVYTLTQLAGLRKYFFAADGTLRKVQDRNGNTLTYSYTSGKLTSITDVASRSTTLTYSGTGGRLSQITDMAGRSTTFGYDSATGNLLTVTYPPNPTNSDVVTFGYDNYGRLIFVRNPAQATSYFTYLNQATFDGASDTESWQAQAACSGGTASVAWASASPDPGGLLKLTLGGSAPCGAAYKDLGSSQAVNIIRQNLVSYIKAPTGSSLTANLYLRDHFDATKQGPSVPLTAGAWTRVTWPDAPVDPTMQVKRLGVLISPAPGSTFSTNTDIFIDNLFVQGLEYQRKDALPDPNGHRVVEQYTYAPMTMQSTLGTPDAVGTLRNTVFTYSAYGWVIQRKNPVGATDIYSYDQYGRLTSSQPPPIDPNHLNSIAPQAVPDLDLWLRADFITTNGQAPADGSALASWLDASGLARHFSNTNTGTQPTYKAGAINGQPAVRFAAADKYLEAVSPSTGNFSGTQGMTVITVAKPDSTANNSLISKRTDTTGWGQTLASGAHQLGLHSASNKNLIIKQSGPATAGSFAVYSATHEASGGPTGVKLYRNGDVQATSTVENTINFATDAITNTQKARLGADNRTSGWGLVGEVAEVLIYNRVLTSAERAGVEAYLKTKYRLWDVVPTDGLQVWLKADQITGVSDGAAVANWPDASGNSNAFDNANETTKRPTYKASGLNGKPTVRFSGGEKYLEAPSSALLNTGTLSVITVAKPETSGSHGLVSKRGPSSIPGKTEKPGWAQSLYTAQHQFGLYGPGQLEDYYGGDVAIQEDGTATYNQFGIYTASANNAGASLALYKDGTQQTATVTATRTYDAGNSNSVKARVGDDPYGGGALSGEIAEVLIYNRQITASERVMIENYLRTKYGLWPTNVPVTGSTSYTYWTDSNSKPTNFVKTVQDPMGAKTYSGVNTANGDVRYTVAPNQQYLREQGQAFTATIFNRDANGNVTSQATNKYAANANLDGSFPTPQETFNTTSATYYTSNGYLVASTTDALGYTTSYDYDSGDRNKGYMTSSTHAALPGGSSRTWSLTVNSDGSVSQVTDPTNKQVLYEYDSRGRPTKTRSGPGAGPGGTDLSTSQVSYNPNGAVATQTDGRGNVTTYVYDANNRVVEVQNPLYNSNGTEAEKAAARTTYSLGVSGVVLSSTTPDGRTRTATYDQLNRTVTTSDPLGNTFFYDFDPRGNQARRVDARGIVTEYAYDLRNALVALNYPANPGNNANYAYDLSGLRTKMVDASGTTTYAYDDLGRVTSESVPNLGGSTVGGEWIRAAGSLSYTYNAASQVATLTYPNNTVATYAYVADGLMSSVSISGVTYGSYIYDNAGRMTNVTNLWTNGKQTAYSYDAAGRVSVIDHRTGTTPSFMKQTYGYDTANNVTSRLDAGYGSPYDTTYSFTYDALNRNRRGTDLHSYLTPYKDPWYDYDGAGNRTKLWHSAGEPPADPYAWQTAYTYDTAGRLTNDGTNSGTIGYDANGNETTYTVPAYSDEEGYHPAVTTTKYLYDEENRMIGAPDSCEASKDAYNGDGLRAIANCGRTAIAYSGASRPSPLYERDMWAAGTARLYLYGANGLLGRWTSGGVAGTWTFYHTDRQGSVIATSDGSGNVVSKFQYDAWGAIQYQSGPDETLGWLGAPKDGTGLSYLGARHYNPVTGRFLAQDPVAGADSHPYAYSGNNPATRSDPTGMAGTVETDAVTSPTTIGGITYIPPTRTLGPMPSSALVGGGGAGGFAAPAVRKDGAWRTLGGDEDELSLIPGRCVLGILDVTLGVATGQDVAMAYGALGCIFPGEISAYLQLDLYRCSFVGQSDNDCRKTGSLSRYRCNAWGFVSAGTFCVGGWFVSYAQPTSFLFEAICGYRFNRDPKLSYCGPSAKVYISTHGTGSE